MTVPTALTTLPDDTTFRLWLLPSKDSPTSPWLAPTMTFPVTVMWPVPALVLVMAM